MVFIEMYGFDRTDPNETRAIKEKIKELLPPEEVDKIRLTFSPALIEKSHNGEEDKDGRIVIIHYHATEKLLGLSLVTVFEEGTTFFTHVSG